MVLGKDELTPTQAAEVLGVSAATVRRWEEKGILLPSRRLPRSGHRRYARADVDAAKAKIAAGEFEDTPSTAT